jgi:hypothetical protein
LFAVGSWSHRVLFLPAPLLAAALDLRLAAEFEALAAGAVRSGLAPSVRRAGDGASGGGLLPASNAVKGNAPAASRGLKCAAVATEVAGSSGAAE